MGDLTTLIDLITRGGLMTALIIALVGGMRGWYVWKQVHENAVKTVSDTLDRTRVEKDKQIDDLIKDRDYWKDMAIRAMQNAGRLTDVFEASQHKQNSR